jgi:hypothetical protein
LVFALDPGDGLRFFATDLHALDDGSVATVSCSGSELRADEAWIMVDPRC